MAAAGYPYFFAVILDSPHAVAIGRLSYGLALAGVAAPPAAVAVPPAPRRPLVTPTDGRDTGPVPDVVIPVLNEAGALPDLLAAMPAGFTAIVVDNGSDDGSADIARAGGARVVDEPRRGFGAACWAGLLAADAADGVVCFMDGDGSFDPADLRRVAGARPRRPVPTWSSAPAAHPPGRVAGPRPPGQQGPGGRDPPADGRPPPRPRPHAGRPPGALVALGIEDRRFGWPLEMVLRAAAAGWRIDEIDVPYSPRVGKSKVTGTVKGTARADQRHEPGAALRVPRPDAYDL